MLNNVKNAEFDLDEKYYKNNVTVEEDKLLCQHK